MQRIATKILSFWSLFVYYLSSQNEKGRQQNNERERAYVKTIECSQLPGKPKLVRYAMKLDLDIFTIKLKVHTSCYCILDSLCVKILDQNIVKFGRFSNHHSKSR